MFNDLPEGAANHPEAPYNQTGWREQGKSRFQPGEAAARIAEAIDRMEAAGMKPVMLTLKGKYRYENPRSIFVGNPHKYPWLYAKR